MPGNPWDNDPIIAPAGGGQTPAARGPVYGPAPIRDPHKEAAEARAVEDQGMQRRRDDRQEAQWKASHNPDGSEKPKIVSDGKPTEYQAKSAGFLGRMLQAEGFYNAVPTGSRDPRAKFGQTVHDWAPDTENTLPVWLGGNSPDRQKADQAARNFITASLRQESGATIKPEEFDTQYRIFFPMPGDDEAVLTQKARSRRQAIEGFRIAAGPLAERAVSAVEADANPRSAGENILRTKLAVMKANYLARNPNGQRTWEGMEANAWRKFNNDPRITREARRPAPARENSDVDAILRKHGVIK